MTETASPIDKLRAFLVLAATIGTIAFNWLAASGYVNGVTPEVISGKYPTNITPAGYAFAIWSLIYLGMTAYSIYQLLPANVVRFRGIRSLYIMSCALNCAWIYFWHHDQIAVCLAIILGLLTVLLFINIKLRTFNSIPDSALVKAPFGIYFGWVTAASSGEFRDPSCIPRSRPRLIRIDSRCNPDLIRGSHGSSCACPAYQLLLPARDRLGIDRDCGQTKRPDTDRISSRSRRDRVLDRIA